MTLGCYLCLQKKFKNTVAVYFTLKKKNGGRMQCSSHPHASSCWLRSLWHEAQGEPPQVILACSVAMKSVVRAPPCPRCRAQAPPVAEELTSTVASVRGLPESALETATPVLELRLPVTGPVIQTPDCHRHTLSLCPVFSRARAFSLLKPTLWSHTCSGA